MFETHSVTPKTLLSGLEAFFYDHKLMLSSERPLDWVELKKYHTLDSLVLKSARVCGKTITTLSWSGWGLSEAEKFQEALLAEKNLKVISFEHQLSRRPKRP